MVSHLTDKTSDFIPQLQANGFITVLFSIFDSLATVVSRRYHNRNYQNCPSSCSLSFKSYLSSAYSISALMTKRPRIASLPACINFTSITNHFIHKFLNKASQ